MTAEELEKYKAYRGQIEAQSTLVGVRLGWLIAAEAFLAAAYATVLTVTKGSNVPGNFISQAQVLYTALPIAGMLLAGLVGATELYGIATIQRIARTIFTELGTTRSRKTTVP